MSDTINIKKGTQTNYDALTSKDSNTIYFTTDTHRIYVGSVEYTNDNALTVEDVIDLIDTKLGVIENGSY